MFHTGFVGRQFVAGAGIVAPSLDLSLSTGPLDGRLTFTRASVASYFDTSGLIQTVSNGVPRFDADPVTHAMRGLLIEETRTNSLLQSGDFTNASWTKNNATLAAGIPGPNGATTGSGFISNNTLTGFLSQSFTPVAATPYTLSIYAKAGSLPTILCVMPAAWWADATTRTATFNLTTGVVSGVGGATASATILPVGNGWYRCVLTATPDTAASGVIQAARPSASGDGVTIQFYAFGAQLEAGAFTTSYIPTTVATATRLADLCSMPTGAWFNATQNTLASDFIVPFGVLAGGTGYVSVELDDGTVSNTLVLRCAGPGSNLQTVAFSGNVSAGNVSAPTPYVPYTTTKQIAAFNQSTLAVTTCGNGGGVASVVLSAAPLTINRLVVGSGRLSPLNGWISRVRYWPTVLTNTQLQALTT